MLNIITGALARELERHPITLIFVIALCIFSIYGWGVYAKADDVIVVARRVDAVALQYQTLNISISRANLESQLENIDREIFSLKQEVDKAGRDGESLPEIYKKRISELDSLNKKKIRELSRLDALSSSMKKDASK